MKILIACGGTGGHIYPAIAIAERIKKSNPDAEFLFIGRNHGMENNLVPAAGFTIKGIDASGFDRKHLLKNFKTLKDMFLGSKEVKEIFKEFLPDIVIGTGNYITVPVLSVAKKKHIPCYIHEQNAKPGFANKALSDFADKVFISFEGTERNFAHPNRCVYSGNPVREAFANLNRSDCRVKYGLKNEDFSVLIFGGSLGAQVINEEAIQLIQRIEKGNRNIKVTFVTGDRYYRDIYDAVDGNGDKILPSFVNILAYAYDMPERMCAADVVVCRAGAIAVSEVAASGTASVLIPSPNVTANHQFYNAKALADKGAAILLEEKDLLDESVDLADTVFSLYDDREKLNEMAKSAKTLGKLDAADIIYDNLNL